MSCYHENIEEYMEHHGKEKYNYGSGWLPQFHIKKHKRTIKFRRAQHIHGYVGQNGSGKTLFMVKDTLVTLNGIKWHCENPKHYHVKVLGQTEGYRRVLSTVRLIDPRTGQDHPLYLPYRDHKQLMFAEHVDILFDEVQGVANVRENYSLPLQVVNVLSQLRKKDAVLRWTTPSWSNASTAIKTVTKAVTYCQGRFPIWEAGRTWGSAVHFVAKTYSAVDFDTFTIGVRERLLPEAWETYFRLFKHNRVGAPEAYDTLAEVENIKSQTESGACLHCGGKRLTPRCSCDSEVESEDNYLELYKASLDKEQILTGLSKEEGGTPAPPDGRPTPPRKPVEFPAIPTVIMGLPRTKKH